MRRLGYSCCLTSKVSKLYMLHCLILCCALHCALEINTRCAQCHPHRCCPRQAQALQVLRAEHMSLFAMHTHWCFTCAHDESLHSLLQIDCSFLQASACARRSTCACKTTNGDDRYLNVVQQSPGHRQSMGFACPGRFQPCGQQWECPPGSSPLEGPPFAVYHSDPSAEWYSMINQNKGM